MRVTASIEIEATASTVFAWLARPEKAQVWMTSVSETEIVHEMPGMVGTTFREVVEDAGGRLEMQGFVAGCEPDRRVAFHIESRLNHVDVEYRIEGNGPPVRLTVAADVRWLFPVNVVALFAGRKMRAALLDQLAGELARLEELCAPEGPAADTTAAEPASTI